MKERMAKVLIYSSGDAQLYDDMKVQVDDKGEEWLSPDQVDYLESFHDITQLLSRYTADDFLNTLEPLVISCSPKLNMEPSKAVSARLTSKFYKSTGTPVFAYSLVR